MGSKQTPRLESLSSAKAMQCSMSLFGLCTEHTENRLYLLHSNTPDHFYNAYPYPICIKSVRDGAAAVQMQCLHLPGDGALHGKHSTCQTGSPQSVWYCTPTHYIFQPWFLIGPESIFI